MIHSCPVCSSSQFAEMSSYPDIKGRNFYTKITNSANCYSGIALPYKNQHELNEFYQSGAYWDSASSNHLSLHTHVQAEVRVEYVFKRSKFKSLEFSTLDVGAGHGHIATALKAKRAVYAKNFSFIEPDNNLSLFIQTNFPSSKRRDFENPGKNYDLIFLNHILEHTASPTETLRSYCKTLNKNGLIYIEVPHRDDKFKPDAFPHSIFFSKEGVQIMIEKAGLKCLAVNTFGSNESIQIPTKFFRKLRFRIIGKISLLAVKLNITYIAKLMDKLLFDYQTERSDGIWIRALCTNNKDY